MRNNGQWTEARYHSFIKSALRSASVKWPPRYSVLSEAFVGSKINKDSGRMAKHYKCYACQGEFPMKQVQVDHIVPVIPITGFDSWDATIERLFCEQDGLRVLCKSCHKSVTQEENKERKKNEKQL